VYGRYHGSVGDGGMFVDWGADGIVVVLVTECVVCWLRNRV